MTKFLSFLAGCGAGAVAALLLTPKTGEEVRGAITGKVREGYDAVSDEWERQGGIRGVLDKGVERGRNIAEEGRRRVAQTVQRGRDRLSDIVGG